jgi:protein-disulfide isomerase
MKRILSICCAALLGGLAACKPAATSEDIKQLQAAVQSLTTKVDALTQRLGGARAAQPQQPPEDYEKVHNIDVSTAPSTGPKDAVAVLVEYSDFQCPYCARADPFIKELKEKYPKDLRVVFKHFPLPFHPAAKPTAIASLAAEEQGKFWEFHDVLFKNFQTLDGSQEGIEKYAVEAGLDVARFKKDLEANRAKYEAQITKDIQEGRSVDVRGTPTLYLNGKKLDPTLRTVDGLSPVIDAAIAKKG